MSLPTLPPRIIRAVSVVFLTLLVVIMLPRLPLDRVYHLGLPSPPPVGLDDPPPIDWSRFAYVQYVTNSAYLCNSVMLFESLHRLGSKPDRLMMYPSSFSEDALGDSTESRLLRKARDEYGVKLMPIQVQIREGGDSKSSKSYVLLYTQLDSVYPPLPSFPQMFNSPQLIVSSATWAESYTKLLAFNQTQYDRVLSLDSDSTVLQVRPLPSGA